MAMDNNTKRVGPDPDLPAIRRRSTRLNCEEFETVNPEQKILTPDEKVRASPESKKVYSLLDQQNATAREKKEIGGQ